MNIIRSYSAVHYRFCCWRGQHEPPGEVILPFEVKPGEQVLSLTSRQQLALAFPFVKHYPSFLPTPSHQAIVGQSSKVTRPSAAAQEPVVYEPTAQWKVTHVLLAVPCRSAEGEKENAGVRCLHGSVSASLAPLMCFFWGCLLARAPCVNVS